MDMQEIKAVLAVKHEAIEAKMAAVEEKAGSSVDKAEYKSAIKELDDAIKALDKQIVDLAQKSGESAQEIESKSFGSLVVESEGIKSFLDGTASKGRTEVKNTIVNSGNNTSVHDQLSGAFGGAFRNLTVMPTLMVGPASSNIIYYSRETTWTNNAAVTVEGNLKPESDLDFTEANTAIKTHAHFIKVSKQALDDSTFLSAYIDRRMRHGVNNAIEAYVITDATDGWVGNSTATSPLLTTDIYGLANKMKYEIIGADYKPAYYYMNPADWSAAETERRASGDNAFVAASGAVTYVNNGLTPLLWGLPVVLTNNVPAGTMYCKAVDADMYANREEVVVEMFEQDGDNAQRNLVTVRAEARGAECVFAPLAIRSGDITAITAA